MVVIAGQGGSRGVDCQSAIDSARPPSPLESAVDIARGRWKSNRGHDVFRSSVELVGAFPGAISCGHRVQRARLRVTERYLICDEGRRRGFAIDVDDVVDIAIVPAPSRVMSALRIRYRESEREDLVRSFVFRIRGLTNSLYGVRRVRSLARLFAVAGIPVTETPIAHPPRRLALSWDVARLHSAELMVWSGEANAPVGGWMNRDRVSCRVWLTGQSLFWCDPGGDGVNRIPIDDILDVSAQPDAVPPAIVVSLLDSAGDRQELLFSFDAGRNLEANRRECQTLVNAFDSRDVAVVDPTTPLMPWKPLSAAIRLQGARPERIEMLDGEHFPEPGPGERAHLTTVAPDEPSDCISEFEANCLAEIATINQQIINPIDAIEPDESVLPAVLSVALDAVAIQLADGSMEIGDADNRVRRLKLLSESLTKLRAIRHQQVAGLRAKSVLVHERRAVMTSLSEILA